LARFNDRPGILGEPTNHELIVESSGLNGQLITMQKLLDTRAKELDDKQKEVTLIDLLSTSHNCTVFFVCILDYPIESCAIATSERKQGEHGATGTNGTKSR
jgi:hypothetical protein